MCQRRSTVKTCKRTSERPFGIVSARYFTMTVPRPDKHRQPLDRSAWGWHIKRVRLQLGIDTKGAAKRIGVAQNTIYGWEAGVFPKVRHIPAIINFIGFIPFCRSPYQSTLEESFIASREIRGLRIADLAALAGLSFKQVWRVENGKAQSDQHFAKIEKALSIPVRQLFSGSQTWPRS